MTTADTSGGVSTPPSLISENSVLYSGINKYAERGYRICLLKSHLTRGGFGWRRGWIKTDLTNLLLHCTGQQPLGSTGLIDALSRLQDRLSRAVPTDEGPAVLPDLLPEFMRHGAMEQFGSLHLGTAYGVKLSFEYPIVPTRILASHSVLDRN